MSVTLINGIAYDNTQLEVIYLGVPLPSVTSLDYGETADNAFNMGVGNRPVSFGRGAIEASGSIEISMNDIEAIRDSLPSGSLLQIGLSDIVVVFTNPQKPITHVIKNVAWTSDTPSVSQGDTDIKVSLDFVASNIQWR